MEKQQAHERERAEVEAVIRQGIEDHATRVAQWATSELREALLNILTTAEYNQMKAMGDAADLLGLRYDEAHDRYFDPRGKHDDTHEDTYFDRTVCACGAMHNRCQECGRVVGEECPAESVIAP